MGLRGSGLADTIALGFPAGVVAISFDDGHRSSVDACEMLLARGWSATLFVVPAWIDAGRDDMVRWRDLARLRAAGIEIAAHGFAHDAPCGRDSDALEVDFCAARDRIEQGIGDAALGLAYPFGLAPRAARMAARRAGFGYACTSEPGRNENSLDRFRLRRNEILATDDRPRKIRAKLAGSDDWMRPLRRLENWLSCGA
jgi:peptidoglycan/xylan/chitin deacetylase (PgdA/CDA1 family)